VVLATDASKYGWGAHISDISSPYFHLSGAQGLQLAQGPSQSRLPVIASGVFNPEQQELGSTVREFDAVIAAL
jgi:hypothetical protein